MRLDSINKDTTSFKMRYKSPTKWGQKTLKTFMDSDLRKDIDSRYKEATAEYKVKTRKAKDKPGEKIHQLTFTLNLRRGKKWSYTDTTLNSPELLDDMFSRKIGNETLFSIEQTIKKERAQKIEREKYIKLARKANFQYFIQKLKIAFEIN